MGHKKKKLIFQFQINVKQNHCDIDLNDTYDMLDVCPLKLFINYIFNWRKNLLYINYLIINQLNNFV